MSAVRSKVCHHSIDTIIIGAGHAGLAASHFLTALAIEHLILERGEVANSWRKERWDSLKLFTPNWQTRLPGYDYSGSDPDGYMNVKEVIGLIESYATSNDAPVQTGTTVTSVKKNPDGYRVKTDRGTWHCKSIIIASGACNLPAIPNLTNDFPTDIQQIPASDYRNPETLQEGGVLIVGASATGLQLAQEIRNSGRQVTIATGEHVRLPRNYRGKDIQWWMEETGLLDEGLKEIDDVNRARKLPSPQLVGSQQHDILDLNALAEMGVKFNGRLMAINNGVAQFSGSLKNLCALADLKMNRLLTAIDAWISESGQEDQFDAPHRFIKTMVDQTPRLGLNLAEENIKTVIWATGFRPDYSWLDVPVLDRKGLIRHEGGIADAPGMYLLGMPFLRRRRSSFIHGIEDDARFVTRHLAKYLLQGEG